MALYKKSTAFTKILNHPSADLIIRKLSSGVSVRDVAKFLEEMYPDDKKLQISFPTLQKFRRKHIKIEADTINLLREEKLKKELEKEEKKQHTQVKKFPSYKEKVKEALDLQIDVKKQLASLHSLIMARTEILFDKLAAGEGSKLDEANLQKYFQTYITVLEKWAKFVDKIADYTVETNVNVTVIENQMALLREAVWEIIREMDSSLAVRFLEKLDNKMKNFNYRQDRVTLEEIDDNVKALSEKIDMDNNEF